MRDGYEGVFIVDSDGWSPTVTKIVKVGTIGPFWGWNILGEQRIRLAYTFDEKWKHMSVEEVKARTLESFRSSDWREQEDFDELREGVVRAQSIRELIQIFDRRSFTNSRWY